MIATLRLILEGALQRLSAQVTATLPPLLAAGTILLAACILARAVRWLLTRAFKGASADRFFRESGMASLLDRSGEIRCAPLLARAAYWLILLGGMLTGLSAFNTALSNRLVEQIVLLLPKLVTAAVILPAGAWIARHLGRTVLVWMVNEGLPAPRRWALAVRIAVSFLAVVVAADALDFARAAFLAAFIILAGGAVCAGSLAVGLGARDSVSRYLAARSAASREPETSTWNHL